MVQYIDEQYIMKKLKGGRVWAPDKAVVEQVIGETVKMQKALSSNNTSELEAKVQKSFENRKKAKWILVLIGLVLSIVGIILFNVGVSEESVGSVMLGFLMAGIGICMIFFPPLILTKRDFYMKKAWDTAFLANQLSNVCNSLGIDYEQQSPGALQLAGSTTVLGWGTWTAFGVGVLLTSFSKSRADTKNTAIKWGDYCFRYNQIAAHFNKTHPQQAVRPQQSQSQAKFCTNCGASLGTDAAFCTGCGTKQ